MADLNLPALHTELLRALIVARNAHDEGVKALRSAITQTEKDRHRQVLYGLADTVNAVQGCVYTTAEAVRNAAPACTCRDGRGRPRCPVHEAPHGARVEPLRPALDCGACGRMATPGGPCQRKHGYDRLGPCVALGVPTPFPDQEQPR